MSIVRMWRGLGQNCRVAYGLLVPAFGLAGGAGLRRARGSDRDSHHRESLQPRESQEETGTRVTP